MRLDLRYIYQRCADADMLASAPVFVRTIASASAGFCRQPSADVRRRAASHCQMSVTVKQSAYIIITWCTGTTTQGRGLSLLREMFHHEFAILRHIKLQLLLQFEKNIYKQSIAASSWPHWGVSVFASAAEQNFASASVRGRSTASAQLWCRLQRLRAQ